MQQLFSSKTYQDRRQGLCQQVDTGLILLLGNDDVGMNYHDNTYHYRQDSNFLYYIGIDQAGLNAIIDADENTTTLFGNDLTLDDVVWTGPQASIATLAGNSGIKNTAPATNIAAVLADAIAKKRSIHFLPPYRGDNKIKLYNWLNINPSKQKEAASEVLIKAVIAQRSIKSAEEIAEMTKAVNTSRAMHVAVMKAAKTGMKESELVGIAKGIAVAMNGETAYPIILTTDGQTLHNHHHHKYLKEGQLVLADMGASTPYNYAGDITRTFPVNKTFSAKQKEIYELVLAAETQCIAACKAGVTYQSIHLKAAKIMATGLKELGLMKGDIDEAINLGAHALFFPHGLGHQIGLDVHDMEDLGEDLVGYDEHTKRSDLFGTAYLRLGKALEPGFVLTVEPGIYFIPELMDKWRADGKFTDFINYDKVNEYRDFSGIRIEDNILVTEDKPQVLGMPIPKTVAEIEGLRND